ncbi:MAG: hypothetical protein HRF46_07940 [Acidobacteriota bacterium]|jgi:D-glycero-alpha-D-manno-heptose-7-phosphate kinase
MNLPGDGAVVEVFAPGRADLAGGTLDLWPLYCFHPGAVTVNVALGEGVRLRARRLPDEGVVRVCLPGTAPVEFEPAMAPGQLVPAVAAAIVPEGGVELEVEEQLPLGSGLGGSSVLAVAVARACLALAGRRLSPPRLVGLLKDVEAAVLGAPTGCQDYYPALLGGALAIHLAPGGERVERLVRCQRWIEQRLAVVFTGASHHSGMVNWEVYRRRVDGEGPVARTLGEIVAAARDCRAGIRVCDGEAVGQAIAAEWQARRRLAPAVSTPEVEAVIQAGLAAGALAGKTCGAGGGGSVLLWTAPDRREAVMAAALAAAGTGARRIATTARPPSLVVRGELA